MPQLILNASPAQASRVAAALGKEHNLVDGNGQPRAATMAEVKDFLIDVLKRLVAGVEDRDNRAAVPPPTDLGDMA